MLSLLRSDAQLVSFAIFSDRKNYREMTGYLAGNAEAASHSISADRDERLS
jgi:hypothetical protein